MPDVSAPAPGPTGEDRREQILTAAAAVFARRGLHQARMDDIVREAGLSKGTIYWYFASKDAVIEALMQRIFTPSLDSLHAILNADGPAYDRLLAATEHSVGMVRQVLDLELLPLFGEYYARSTRDEHARQVLQAYAQMGKDMLLPLFEQGIARGEFRPVDAELACMSYMALLDGLLVGEHVYPDRRTLPERILAGARLLLDGLRAA